MNRWNKDHCCIRIIGANKIELATRGYSKGQGVAETIKTPLTVRDLMVSNPTTLDLNETLDLPENIMNLGRIRHMAVVEDGKIHRYPSQRDFFRSALITALGFGRKNHARAGQDDPIKEIILRHIAEM